MKCKYCNKTKKNNCKTCGNSQCARKAQTDTMNKKGYNKKKPTYPKILLNKSIEELKNFYMENHNNSNIFRTTGFSKKELRDITLGMGICKVCGKQTGFVGCKRGYKQKCSTCNKNNPTYKMLKLKKEDIKEYIEKHKTSSFSTRSKGIKLKSSAPLTNFSFKELYDEYYGICKPLCQYCQKERKFINFSRGYNKTCGDKKCTFTKINSSSYHNHKKYKTPSGKIIKIQGFEYILLDILYKQYDEEDIITNIQDIPSFEYMYENSIKNYYPDVYVKSINTIFEVKSSYTLDKEKHKNEAKFNAVKRTNYNFELCVYDKKILSENII